MMPIAPPDHRPIISAGRGRRGLLAGLLTLALALPSAAHSYTLDELLRMPLERLLQLEISAQLTALAVARGALTRGVCSVDGSHHAA
jgi:hypothetical protein